MLSMKTLPIHTVLPQLVEALGNASAAILQAPPGAGKTTAVPLACLNVPWCKGKIVVLEPRRLAVRAAAQRMAQLTGERVGETVGYRMRSETKVSARTRIEVVTEGVFVRLLQDDPSLESVSLVIFDEFHERSLDSDLSLALSLQVQALLREDLKLLVMSATLDTSALGRILPESPVIRSEGRMYPVEVRYLDIRKPQPTAATIADAAADATMRTLHDAAGDILVFLPGAAEIRKAQSKLRKQLNGAEGVRIEALYGALDFAAQRRAIEPSDEGERKIVLATNIAETSLTIEGVRIVIDGGLERRVRYDAASGMDRYETVPVSRDSATQRCGRAGREGPGSCLRLWHEGRALRECAEPAILTSDLAPTVMELACWGAQAQELTWIDPPPEHALSSARALLRTLDVIDERDVLTAHGSAVAAMRMHPRLGHMLSIAHTKGFGYEAALAATALHENDLRFESSDFAEHLERLHAAIVRGDERFRHARRHFARLCRQLNIASKPAPDVSAAGAVLALAYPDRIAQCRDVRGERYLLSGGKGVRLRADDGLRGEPFLAVAEAGGAGTEATVFRAAKLDENVLYALFDARIETETTVAWNREAKRVEARTAARLGALTLRSSPAENAAPELLEEAMLEGIRTEGIGALSWSKKARGLRQRMACAFRFAPERFVDVSDTALLESLETWLSPWLGGVTSLKALEAIDLYGALGAMLDYETRRTLDRLVPENIAVPSGSKIRIDYTDPEQPILPVRLQEMFGLHETPSIFDGKVTLTLHLLSPAHRPVQVTKDLRSFWEHGYAEVRRELRGRYKKHYWPENPFEAVATAKTKRGMASH